MAGKSVSDLILDERFAFAALPCAADLQAHLRPAEPFRMQLSLADLVLEDRNAA